MGTLFVADTDLPHARGAACGAGVGTRTRARRAKTALRHTRRALGSFAESLAEQRCDRLQSTVESPSRPLGLSEETWVDPKRETKTTPGSDAKTKMSAYTEPGYTVRVDDPPAVVASAWTAAIVP